MSSTNDTYPYHSWDFVYEYGPTPTRRLINILTAVFIYPSIFINLAITFSYFSRPEWRHRSGYLVLVVQNTYDLLFLTTRLVPATLEGLGNTIFPALTDPSNIGCFLGAVADVAWYEHVVAHLMVAGNRFVAIVLYSRYRQWFTVRNTIVYISLFGLLPIVRYIILFGVMGMEMCVLTSGGLAITFPSPLVQEAYGMFDLVITATSIILATILNVISIVRLRQLTKSVQEVQPAVEDGEQGGQQDGQLAVQAGHPAAAKPDKKERRLTIHFLVVTLVFIIKYSEWIIGFFVQLPNTGFSGVLATLNFSINAYTIIIISKDIRRGVFNCRGMC